MFYTQAVNLGAMDSVSPFFQHVFFGKCLGPDGSCVLQNRLEMVLRYYPLYHCPQSCRRVQTDGHLPRGDTLLRTGVSEAHI